MPNEMKNWIIGCNGIDSQGHHFDGYVEAGDVVADLIPLFLALVLVAAWRMIRRKRARI